MDTTDIARDASHLAPVTVLDAAVDLLLGTHCLGCERPGRLVCPTCRDELVPEPAPCWPDPPPAGLAEPWASTSYAGLPRSLVLGLKEDGLLGLRRPLAGLLAAAVRAVVDEHAVDGSTTVLVPVPSRSSTVRARGHDAVGSVVRTAAREVRSSGRDRGSGDGRPDVRVVSLLRLRAGVVDQAGLDAAGRRLNLAGSMWVPSTGLRRLARTVGGPVRVVVCDDVVTTGSTLREAQRALEAVGLPVVACAAVSATRKRVPAGRGSGEILR